MCCAATSDKHDFLVLPVLADTAQNSACISVAILMASFSVLCRSSEGLQKQVKVKYWVKMRN